MGEDGRLKSKVAIFFWDVDIFVASEIILRCGCVESGHEKVAFASKKGSRIVFFLWCGGCLCCIFTPKKLNIALTLSSLFRGYVTMLNFLACIFDLLGESRFELGNWGSNLPCWRYDDTKTLPAQASSFSLTFEATCIGQHYLWWYVGHVSETCKI